MLSLFRQLLETDLLASCHGKNHGNAHGRLGLGPSWCGRFEGDGFAGEGVSERDAMRMEAEGRIGDGVRLRVAELLVLQIGLFAEDRPTEVRQVDADLIRAAGDGAGFNERGAITEFVEDAEFGASR